MSPGAGGRQGQLRHTRRGTGRARSRARLFRGEVADVVAPEAFLLEHARGRVSVSTRFLPWARANSSAASIRFPAMPLPRIGGVDRQRADLAQVRVEVDQREQPTICPTFSATSQSPRVARMSSSLRGSIRRRGPRPRTARGSARFRPGWRGGSSGALLREDGGERSRNCEMWLSSTISRRHQAQHARTGVDHQRRGACPAAMRGATSRSNSDADHQAKARISTMPGWFSPPQALHQPRAHRPEVASMAGSLTRRRTTSAARQITGPPSKVLPWSPGRQHVRDAVGAVSREGQPPAERLGERHHVRASRRCARSPTALRCGPSRTESRRRPAARRSGRSLRASPAKSRRRPGECRLRPGPAPRRPRTCPADELLGGGEIVERREADAGHQRAERAWYFSRAGEGNAPTVARGKLPLKATIPVLPGP